MEEQLKWLSQLRRLFLLSLIYDIAFIDPFTMIKKPNPITGMFGLLIGSIAYLIARYVNSNGLLMISYSIIIGSMIWIFISSYRRRPIYVFDIENSRRIIEEKGIELKDPLDIEHAKAIVEYTLYESQKAETPEEMKKYLDIAYETWLKVLKNKGISFPYVLSKIKSRN
jgi:DNA integrity scanning protein DisA with diadenylate cyclase activity